MKASESNAHYASKVRESSNFAAREIKRVCKDIGARPSASENEAKALAYVENSAERFCDSVKRTEFKASPKAHLYRFAVCGSMMIVSAVLMALALFNAVPAASLAFKIAASVLIALSFVLFWFKNALSAVFPKVNSGNVICTRKASGELKRRIVICGNIDSPYEERINMNFVNALFALELCAAAVINAASYAGLGKIVNIVLGVLVCISVAGYIMALLAVNTKVCVQGANSNLSGVFTSMAALQYLSDNGISFENTEVAAAATGCGEAGNIGARALAASLKDGVETVVVSVNTVEDFERLAAVSKYSSSAWQLIKDAAERAEFTLSDAAPVLGAESAAMGRNGVKAATLTAADASSNDFRTDSDTADKINMKALEAGVKVVLESIFLFDEQGIK